MNSLLVITGGMGAGKTTVLGEASDILARAKIAHAALDVDRFGDGFLPSKGAIEPAMYNNLHCVCENYSKLGVQQFVMARAIESREQLELCRSAASASVVIVCRLVASKKTLEQRVERRETGIERQRYIDRAVKLNGILDEAKLEDITVTNDSGSLTEVAGEMLVKAGWISSRALTGVLLGKSSSGPAVH
jgi:ribose 1,5-bisphosphokinase PhnN